LKIKKGGGYKKNYINNRILKNLISQNSQEQIFPESRYESFVHPDYPFTTLRVDRILSVMNENKNRKGKNSLIFRTNLPHRLHAFSEKMIVALRRKIMRLCDMCVIMPKLLNLVGKWNQKEERKRRTALQY
jgi:hypothetical protein